MLKPLVTVMEYRTLVPMNLSVFLFIASFANASSLPPYREKTRSLPLVDTLIGRLQRGLWKPDAGGCLRATLDMLEGVKNNTLWATWAWDSMQLPTGSLYGAQTYIGNYDQCLQAPWSAGQRHPGLRSQYCMVDLRGSATDQINTLGPFDDTEEYYRMPTKGGRRFSQHYFGVCLPSICSPSSVAEISRHLLQLTHLPDGNVFVEPRNCEAAGNAPEYPVGFYAFWSVVGILFGTTIISTYLNNDGTKQTALGIISRSFCMKRNYRRLVSVSRDDVKMMHGMRFLSAALAVIAHDVLLTVMQPVVNGLYINKLLSSPLGLALLHIDLVVDTFFAMSGLLLVRGLMLGKQKNAFYSLVKRYIRLIGPFMLCIMYTMTTSELVTQGPLRRTIKRSETEVCAKNWWKSLLMANTDITTVCPMVTWYISCDFQLATLGTFLVCLCKRNRRLGVGAFVVVAAALTLNLGLTVYSNQMDILPFNYKVITSPREFPDLNYTYFSSFARAGPYLVGMAMGYIISIYKPAEHRHTIGQKWSVLIAAVSLLVGGIVFSVGAIFAGRPYDPLEAAVVVATNRAFWAVMICSLIGVCEYGSLTLIPEFLSWPGFAPLSKLSYCIYLLHPILMELQKTSARSAVTFTIYNTILNVCGVLVLVCGLSLVLHLILEAPIINISNLLFTDESKPLERNGTKAEISQNGNSIIIQRNEQNGRKEKSC